MSDNTKELIGFCFACLSVAAGLALPIVAMAGCQTNADREREVTNRVKLYYNSINNPPTTNVTIERKQ